jgi:hypothetical protein
MPQAVGASYAITRHLDCMRNETWHGLLTSGAHRRDRSGEIGGVSRAL